MCKKAVPVRGPTLRGGLFWIGLVFLLFGGMVLGVNALAGWCDGRLAFTAWGVCVISSLAAHIAGKYPRSEDKFAARLVLSIAGRTALPLIVAVAASVVPSIPFERGFVFLIVLFYLVGLVADVSLQARRLNPDTN